MRKLCIISVFFAITPFLFNCDSNDDSDVIEEGLEIEIFTRVDCSSQPSQQGDATVLFYTTEDLFDYTNRTLIDTVVENANGNYFIELEDGNYYFEVLNSNDDTLLKGIYRIPEDLTEDGRIYLSTGRKRGVVKHDGVDGDNIPNAEIVYTEEITGEQFVAFSDQDGRHCIELNPGRYYVTVTHPNYETYTTEPGFSVFWSGYDGASNFFLELEE